MVSDIAIGVIALVVLVVGFFALLAIVEIRKAVRSLNNFIEKTDNEMGPTIRSLKESLDTLNEVLEDVHTLTDGTRQIGQNLKDVSEKIALFIESVSKVKEESRVTVVALKAGLREGLKSLIRNLTT